MATPTVRGPLVGALQMWVGWVRAVTVGISAHLLLKLPQSLLSLAL